MAGCLRDSKVSEPKRCVDLAGGVGFIEGVEVDTCDRLIEQFGALLGGVVDACAFDRFGVGVGAV
jgi:hypothetical protein